jgi:[ribosomal protein S5]-alanine N-acetyltransferase
VIGAFETERLRAEPLDRSHLDLLAALHGDERVMATLGGVGTEDDTREWLERNVEHWRRHGFGLFVFRDRATGSFVARAGIRRIEIGGREEVEVAYALVPERWGAGLATEIARALVAVAFERLELPDVVAYTLPTNVASRRVLEKAGLAYEGDVEHAGRTHVLYRRSAAP